MKPSTIGRSYGWKPQLPDVRDHQFRLSAPVTSNPTTDLRAGFQLPYDQGSLGSCTANATAAAVAFDLARQKLLVFTPSRLFIYYNERDMEGSVPQDSGAEIRDGIKSINSLGVCAEDVWPYDISKFSVRPPAPCYTLALNCKSVQYEAVNQDLDSIKACLTQGTPIVIGFTVYESFEGQDVAKSGLMPMPSPDESVLGGHAVVIAGANDSAVQFNGIPPRHFVVRNSWGSGWGADGYFFMPFEYLLNQNLASDFWAIQVMA